MISSNRMIKLCGYASGLLCLIVKLFLIYLICFFSIKERYAESNTVEMPCIAVSVSTGLSTLYNIILFVMKGKNPFKKLMKFFWFKQYLLSAIAVCFFIQFIKLDHTNYFWTKAFLPVGLLTLEFLFFKSFVEVKAEEVSLYRRPPHEIEKNTRNGKNNGNLPIEKHNGNLPEGKINGNLPNGKQNVNLPNGKNYGNLPNGKYIGNFPDEKNNEDLPNGKHNGNLPNGKNNEYLPNRNCNDNLPNGKK